MPWNETEYTLFIKPDLLIFEIAFFDDLGAILCSFAAFDDIAEILFLKQLDLGFSAFSKSSMVGLSD